MQAAFSPRAVAAPRAPWSACVTHPSTRGTRGFLTTLVRVYERTWILVETDADDDVVEVAEDNNLGVSDKVLLDSQLTCNDDDMEPNNAAAIATYTRCAFETVRTDTMLELPLRAFMSALASTR